MEMPSRMVIRLARTFWAVSDRESRTPHSRIRLPNIRKPISATASGATRPTMTVTTMGNRILVVLETGLPLYCILMRRSALVVQALMTGG